MRLHLGGGQGLVTLVAAALTLGVVPGLPAAIKGIEPDEWWDLSWGRGTVAVYGYGTADNGKPLVVLGHGYLEHGRRNARLIRFILDQGYRVLAWDLPGHGRSSGEPGTVEDFAHYGAALEAVTLHALGLTEGAPLTFVGHSTSCAAFLTWERSPEAQLHEPFPYDRTIFIAPLVRSWLYGLSGIGHGLGKGFLRDLRPRTTGATHDQETNRAFFLDPLNTHRMPVSWVAVHRRWERKTRAWEPRPRPLVVIQGTADTVLDWRYNVNFLRRVYPESTVLLVAGGYHSLQDEADPWGTRTYEYLTRLLSK